MKDLIFKTIQTIHHYTQLESFICKVCREGSRVVNIKGSISFQTNEKIKNILYQMKDDSSKMVHLYILIYLLGLGSSLRLFYWKLWNMNISYMDKFLTKFCKMKSCSPYMFLLKCKVYISPRNLPLTLFEIVQGNSKRIYQLLSLILSKLLKIFTCNFHSFDVEVNVFCYGYLQKF